MQRILRIEAGGSIAGTVYPLEGVGLVDDGCEACKKIQVTVPRAGELIVRLVVGGDTLRLVIAREDGQPLDAPLAVEAGATVDVFVTSAVAPSAFQLTTSLTSR
jgi:phage tail sheath gpL-like